MKRNLKQFIEELKVRQRNTTWPDPWRNSRRVDEVLWRGSPNAPLVQRIGAWLIGLLFIFMGLSFLPFAFVERVRGAALVSLFLVPLGIKIFMSGCRRR